MNKKITWGVAVVVVIILIIVLVNQSPKNTTEPLKIGALYTLTGPIAAYGEFQKQSAETAVQEINDSGGIDGKPVELLIEDTASDAKTGVDAFNALKSKGVRFYVVEYSPVAAAVRPLIVNDGNFVITSGATTPAYIDGSNLSCRLTMTAKDIGPALADYALGHKEKTAALLLPNNDYGKGLADEFSKAFSNAGGTITTSEFYDPTGTGDFRTNITKVKSHLSDTDVLITVNVANTAESLLQQLVTLGWNKPILSDYNTIQNPALKDKKLADGIAFVDWAYTPEPNPSDSEVTKAFKQKYIADHQQNPTIAAAGYYDGVKVMLDAIKQVGPVPQKVADYIQGLKNYPVVTGTIISFDSDCQATRTHTMLKVQDSQVVNAE